MDHYRVVVYRTYYRCIYCYVMLLPLSDYSKIAEISFSLITISQGCHHNVEHRVGTVLTSPSRLVALYRCPLAMRILRPRNASKIHQRASPLSLCQVAPRARTNQTSTSFHDLQPPNPPPSSSPGPLLLPPIIQRKTTQSNRQGPQNRQTNHQEPKQRRVRGEHIHPVTLIRLVHPITIVHHHRRGPRLLLAIPRRGRHGRGPLLLRLRRCRRPVHRHAPRGPCLDDLARGEDGRHGPEGGGVCLLPENVPGRVRGGGA